MIEVSAKRATMDTYLEVWFDGAVDEHRTEIQLECPEGELIVAIIMQELKWHDLIIQYSTGPRTHCACSGSRSEPYT